MAGLIFKLMLVIVTLYLAFGGKFVAYGVNPNDSDWILDINCYTLFTLVRESEFEPGYQQSESILKVFFKSEDINEKYIDGNMIKRLTDKIRNTMKPAVKALKAGGRQGAACLDKLKQTMYKLKLGGVKHKLEHELESEKKKRKLAENELENEKKKGKVAEKEGNKHAKRAKDEVKKRKQLALECKKKVKKAHAMIARILRRRQGKRMTKKDKYGRTWMTMKKKDLNNSIKFACDLLAEEGVSVQRMLVKDTYGNTVDFANILANIGIPSEASLGPSVDRMLYIKDVFMIPDLAYQAVAIESSELIKLIAKLNKLNDVPKYPSLYALQARTKELNGVFSVERLANGKGVQERLEIKLRRLLENVWPFPEDEVTIKITGDGTTSGRLHITNFGMCVITNSWRSDDLILAIAKIGEKYNDILDVLHDVIHDSKTLQSITIHGKVIKLKYIICADLKFTNVILGLGACSANCPCAWCKMQSSQFYDVVREETNEEISSCARTIGEMQQLCQKKKSKKHDNYNCIKPPIFPHIPISHIIPDPLHLYLRISDQLIRQLILYIRTSDNIRKNQKNVDKSKCTTVLKFEQFVQGLGIDWHFYTDKDGFLTNDTFIGPQHQKIQKAICLDDFYGPDNPKLGQLKHLWTEFVSLINEMKQDMTDEQLEIFKSRTTAWVDCYYKVHTSHDITLYMHVFAKHVDDSIRLHGNLSKFSQQTFEKLNDRIKSWYFSASNHRNVEALMQVMNKQNRIEFLEPTCQREPKYRVTCSVCSETGHNKRTCPENT